MPAGPETLPAARNTLTQMCVSKLLRMVQIIPGIVRPAIIDVKIRTNLWFGQK